jgi:hypothetical protein
MGDRLVHLLERYSNRSDLLDDLNRASRELERALKASHSRRSVMSQGRINDAWRMRDRLSDDELRQIVRDRLAGASQLATAKKYGISESSVKRIMRQHRAASKIIDIS